MSTVFIDRTLEKNKCIDNTGSIQRTQTPIINIFIYFSRVRSMRIVDIYPMMCELLGILPAPNNGSIFPSIPIFNYEGHMEAVMMDDYPPYGR